jgi:hypothetical protein
VGSLHPDMKRIQRCDFFPIPAHNGDDVWSDRSAMPRTPSEYVVHMLFDGGHREEVRFHTIQEFQKWYSGEFVPKSTSDEFISVPVPKINPGEYMVIRPSRLLAIRVEPIFSSSVERY